MSKKIVPFKEDSTALVGNFQGYYVQLAESREIKKIIADIGIFKRIEMSPETIEQSKAKAVALKKEIERLRQIVAVPAKQLVDANQAFFKPLLAAIDEHKRKLEDKYRAHIAEERRKREERQRELDRQREQEIKKKKQEHGAAVDFAKLMNLPMPGDFIEPPQVFAAEPAVIKKVLPKSIDIQISDIVSLAKYLLRPGGEIPAKVKEFLFMEIFDAKIKPLQDLIRKYEGNQALVDELRNAGVFINTYGDYGVK